MYFERGDTIATFFFSLINQNQQKILFEQGHYCHLLRIYKPSEKDFLSTLIGF